MNLWEGHISYGVQGNVRGYKSEHKGIGNMGTRGHTRQDSWIAWELMRGACWDLLGTHGGIQRMMCGCQWSGSALFKHGSLQV